MGLSPFKHVLTGFKGVKGVIDLEAFVVFSGVFLGPGSTVHCIYGFLPPPNPGQNPGQKSGQKYQKKMLSKS